MAEPREVLFACDGCGAWNAAAAPVCAGCGRRFAGTGLKPRSRIVLPPRPPENLYEPPSAPIAPPRTMRIGTALFQIAIVAACLAAFRESVLLGALATLSLTPAAIRTPIVAGKRRAYGSPMDFPEIIGSFVTTMICTWAVMVSSLVSFGVTGFVAGMMGGDLHISLALGSTTAIACAILMTKKYLKMGRNHLAKDQGIRYP